MCIVFYTVNPEPPTFPKSFIVRIFKDDDDRTQCLKPSTSLFHLQIIFFMHKTPLTNMAVYM